MHFEMLTRVARVSLWWKLRRQTSVSVYLSSTEEDRQTDIVYICLLSVCVVLLLGSKPLLLVLSVNGMRA